MGAFEHHAHSFQLGQAQRRLPAGRPDALGAFGADARHPQQHLKGGAVDVYGEQLVVLHSPAALGVQAGVEVGVLRVQQLLCPEVIEPQQPVCLVQPVLPQQRGLCVQSRQACIGGYRDVGRVEYPFELVVLVQPFGQPQDLVVALRRGAHDHLGALARRGKPGGTAVEGQLLPVGLPADGDLLHGAQNGAAAFVRRQQAQALLTGQLDVHAQPVGQIAHLLHKLRAGAGDGLGVDVPAKAVLAPQQTQDLQHPLGGIVRGAQHGAG